MIKIIRDNGTELTLSMAEAREIRNKYNESWWYSDMLDIYLQNNDALPEDKLPKTLKEDAVSDFEYQKDKNDNFWDEYWFMISTAVDNCFPFKDEETVPNKKRRIDIE